MNGKTSYRIVVALAAGTILWTLFVHLIQDPQAADFLRHKSGLPRAVKLPVWLRVLDAHIAAAGLAIAAGALNFSGRLRRASRRLHRAAGYAYIAGVLGVVATSGYMAPYATGGRAVGMAFNLLNLLWTGLTLAAYLQVRRRRFVLHRRWMIRSYVFCYTNVSIHALESLFHRLFGMSYAAGYATAVYGTIFLLLLAAETIVRLSPSRPTDAGSKLPA